MRKSEVEFVRNYPLIAQHHERRNHENQRHRKHLHVVYVFPLIENPGCVEAHLEHPDAEPEKRKCVEKMHCSLALLDELAERNNKREQGAKKQQKVENRRCHCYFVYNRTK